MLKWSQDFENKYEETEQRMKISIETASFTIKQNTKEKIYIKENPEHFKMSKQIL